MDTKTIIEIGNAALTPVIAIVAAYVAYQQYKINRSKLRHDLYERRLNVFKAIMAYFSEIAAERATRYSTVTKFYADTGEAEFLFGEEITKQMELLYKKGMNLAALYERMYPSNGEQGLPVGEERNKVADQHSALVGWFLDEPPRTKDMFKSYLKVDV